MIVAGSDFGFPVHGSAAFIHSLAAVLCVAALTTLICARFRLPSVLGLLLAGLLVGPFGPQFAIADPDTVRALSELGIILLMFTIGLELSLGKLGSVGLKGAAIALSGAGIVLLLGFSVARMAGFSLVEAVFLAASLSISSTMVVARTLRENKVAPELKRMIFGVLVIEDVLAILFLVLLTLLASTKEIDGTEVFKTVGRLLGFLLALITIGALVVPRTLRWVARRNSNELLLLVSMGVCFAGALSAQAFGYSVALGAFVAGSLCAESGLGKRIEHVCAPLRDLFAAVFFVSAGMAIEPAALAENWQWIVIFAPLVVAGKFLGVSAGFFFTGHSVRTSVQAGMNLGQMGEFGLIIVALGASYGIGGSSLFAIAAGVAALTIVATPYLARSAPQVAVYIDSRLPRRMQTFAALYGSWVERLRERGIQAPRTRRLLTQILLDAALLALLGMVTALFARNVAQILSVNIALTQWTAMIVVYGGFAVLAVPLALGMYGLIRRLGNELAIRALPMLDADSVDFAQAPRRAFVLTLQLGLLLSVSVPLLVLLQPFFPSVPGVLVLLSFCMLALIGFWRSAGDLEAHTRAGAQAVLEAFKSLTREQQSNSDTKEVEAIESLLPGLGEFVGLEIERGHLWVGQTLGQVNLRGLTGATVLAIRREHADVLTPEGKVALEAADTLVLAGTKDALAAALKCYQQSAP